MKSFSFCNVIACSLFLFAFILQGEAVAKPVEEVIVYTSSDQLFAEPVLDLFEEQTGIHVLAVYDVEAAKTVGLTNRLLAEKNHPKADVFWNSESSRTIALQKKDIFAPYFSPERIHFPQQFKDPDGYWTGFACRARILIYNTDMLSQEDLPRSLFELADPKWKGRVAMAYPLLGTAATHMGALYALMGQEKAELFLQSLKENAILITAGNSVVRDVVAAGEVPVGITDTDDALVAIHYKKPVAMIYPDQEGSGAFLIPNTVALVNNGPNPENGKQMINFLLSRQVEEILAASLSGNIPVRNDIPNAKESSPGKTLKIMKMDYQKAADHIGRSDTFCRKLFSR